MTQEDTPQPIKNILKDTHKEVRYVIMASQKLNFEEKLKQVKRFMHNPMNLRPKRGTTITFNADEELINRLG